jgi:hypothetical protein
MRLLSSTELPVRSRLVRLHAGRPSRRASAATDGNSLPELDHGPRQKSHICRRAGRLARKPDIWPVFGHDFDWRTPSGLQTSGRRLHSIPNACSSASAVCVHESSARFRTDGIEERCYLVAVHPLSLPDDQPAASLQREQATRQPVDLSTARQRLARARETLETARRQLARSARLLEPERN